GLAAGWASDWLCVPSPGHTSNPTSMARTSTPVRLFIRPAPVAAIATESGGLERQLAVVAAVAPRHLGRGNFGQGGGLGDGAVAAHARGLGALARIAAVRIVQELVAHVPLGRR